MTETIALRARVGFNALTKGDVIHVPLPLDEHYQALVRMGLLAADWQTDGRNGDLEPGQVLSVNENGDETTILGVMPVANPARKRGRPRKIIAEDQGEGPHGEGDSEPS